VTWRRIDTSDVYQGPCDACGWCDAHEAHRWSDIANHDDGRDCAIVDGWIDDDRNVLCGTCIAGIDFPDELDDLPDM
jgi:hypothetical protein